MSNADFIAASVAPAQQGYREFHVPVSVTIAQGILESGGATVDCPQTTETSLASSASTVCMAPSPPAATPTTRPSACRRAGPPRRRFRTYATTADSFRDHGRFLTVNQRYLPAFAYTHDPDQFLYQMWRAGYATSPTYVTNVKALMQRYNLYQYDLM